MLSTGLGKQQTPLAPIRPDADKGSMSPDIPLHLAALNDYQMPASVHAKHATINCAYTSP